MWYSPDQSPWMGYPQMANNYNCRGFPQDSNGLSPIGSPTSGSCTKKTSPQKAWLCKPEEVTFHRLRLLWEIRTLLLKWCTQNLTYSRTQERSGNLKGVWIKSTYWSCKAFLRQCELTLEKQTLVAAVLGSSYCHIGTGASKHHFGILLLHY